MVTISQPKREKIFSNMDFCICFFKRSKSSPLSSPHVYRVQYFNHILLKKEEMWFSAFRGELVLFQYVDFLRISSGSTPNLFWTCSFDAFPLWWCETHAHTPHQHFTPLHQSTLSAYRSGWCSALWLHSDLYCLNTLWRGLWSGTRLDDFLFLASFNAAAEKSHIWTQSTMLLHLLCLSVHRNFFKSGSCCSCKS